MLFTLISQNIQIVFDVITQNVFIVQLVIKKLEDLKEQSSQMVNTCNHLFDDESVSKLTIELAPHDIFASKEINNLDFEPETDNNAYTFSNKLNYVQFRFS